jgi:CelD/BcsL family acetyltransferase involved in cellulose biosynthesis
MQRDGIEVELIEDRQRIPFSAREWNALSARSETHTIFQTYEWFDAWWSVFGGRNDLFFLILKNRGDIIGFAPFMLRRIGPGLRQLELIGTGNADYLDLVLAADRLEALRAVFAFLRARAHRWVRVKLVNLPVTSSTWQFLREHGPSLGLYWTEEASASCPSLRIEGHEEEARRMTQKYSMRRPLNWFTRQGAVRFRRLETLSEIEEALPRFFDQHIRRWHSVGRHSLFEDPRQRAFYLRLAHNLQGTGWLHFSAVELSGEPLAFHYGFDYDGALIWYKPSFEVRHAERSPGLLLIGQLIEDAVSRGKRELDFTVGEESFKQRFTNHQRRNVYVGVYHSRAAHKAALAIGEARRWAGRTWRRLRGRSGKEAAREPAALPHEPTREA